MNTGLVVGHDSKSVKEIGSVILSILKTNDDQATKQIALETFKDAAQINNVTVTGCSFTG
ncbi:MAG: hypothetical protein DRP42_06885 [Tenericutes bacterium]|nr:MAG: hypothetical protein DRP42_06885 [Mycoplasmatota bacterium]